VIAVLEIAGVTLLWRVLGSATWLKDVAYAVWVVILVQAIGWWDRRRKRQAASS
jgi:hypothetical protein